MDFVQACYDATRRFPREEVYVSIALGSHAELETCLEIAARLNYLDEKP